jgi:YHS domain-containing protein
MVSFSKKHDCLGIFHRQLKIFKEEISMLVQKLVIDPVCGMEVNVKESTPQHHFKGNDFYFCSSKCLELFIGNPSAYVAESEGCCQEAGGHHHEHHHHDGHCQNGHKHHPHQCCRSMQN